MTRRRWTHDELVLALDLYCRIPFGRIHTRNPKVIELADAIGRTPSAVAWKLANFARFDPALQSRNVRGATHGSHADEAVWHEFQENGEDIVLEAYRIYEGMGKQPASAEEPEDVAALERLGSDRVAVTKTRVGQGFFREAVLSSYNWRCCVTGLQDQRLLTASHISPWAADQRNRVNPCNGLCLNALHDRAFDRGLMAVSPDYTIIFSSQVRETLDAATTDLLLRYEGRKLALPDRFHPDPALLELHRETVFLG